MVPLKRTPGRWVEELPSVLWSIRTTPIDQRVIHPSSWFMEPKQFSQGDIHHDLPRVAAYVEADNETTRQNALDALEEERDLAAALSTVYQQDLCCYHSCRVRSRTF